MEVLWLLILLPDSCQFKAFHIFFESFFIFINSKNQAVTKFHVVFDPQGMHLETLSSTANHEGGLAKNIGIAARLLKKM